METRYLNACAKAHPLTIDTETSFHLYIYIHIKDANIKQNFEDLHLRYYRMCPKIAD